MKTNLINSNTIIAEFMGYNVEIVNNERYFTLDDMLESLSDEELHYNDSWDWLMPVIEKCLIGEAEQNSDIVKATINAIYEGICNQNITESYKSVVKYINWYNNN